MSRYSDSSLMSGLGRRRRVRRRVGRGFLTDILGGLLGAGRKRRVGGARRRRRRVGHGFLGDLVSKALPFVKQSGIISHLASQIPGIGGIAGSVAKSAGFGRRRRRVVHRRVGVGMYGARRRVHRRRRHGMGILL